MEKLFEGLKLVINHNWSNETHLLAQWFWFLLSFSTATNWFASNDSRKAKEIVILHFNEQSELLAGCAMSGERERFICVINIESGENALMAS